MTIALAPGCYLIIKRPKPPKLYTSATASSFQFIWIRTYHLITISFLFFWENI